MCIVQLDILLAAAAFDGRFAPAKFRAHCSALAVVYSGELCERALWMTPFGAHLTGLGCAHADAHLSADGGRLMAVSVMPITRDWNCQRLGGTEDGNVERCTVKLCKWVILCVSKRLV